MGSDFRKLVDKMLQTNTKVFGEDVLYYPKEGGYQKIRAIFDNAYQAVDPDTEEIISANQSILSLNLNDINDNEIEKGDLFKIRNNDYKTIDIQEDGQGGAMILIQKIRKDEKTDIRKYPRSSR